jgi:hypothetical protein
VTSRDLNPAPVALRLQLRCPITPGLASARPRRREIAPEAELKAARDARYAARRRRKVAAVTVFALNADRQDVRACGPRSGYVWTFGVEALALADNTRCAVVDQVPTMRFVPLSFQIRSGANFEIPGGLFRPAPGFLAALEPRQVTQRRINSRSRSLRRILPASPLHLPGITGERECCAPAYRGKRHVPISAPVVCHSTGCIWAPRLSEVQGRDDARQHRASTPRRRLAYV